MTKLTKKIERETSKKVGKYPVIVTLAPGHPDLGRPDMIGLRLKGTRTQYLCTIDDIYRTAAFWHGQKVANAKRSARKEGTPWKTAKRAFDRINKL